MGKVLKYMHNENEFYNILKNYALTDKEIEMCYDKGIITPQINNTILKEYDDGFQDYITRTYPKIDKNTTCRSDGRYYKFWYSYLASLGIKMFFSYNPYNVYDRDNEYIYITDFHLVFSKKLEYIRNGLDKTKIYKKPEILIIPLNKIKKLELKLLGEKNYYREGYSYIKEGSPELGAIIGGAIAGTTGAIAGALANQTKVVNEPGKVSTYDEYSLIIELKNGKKMEFKTFANRKYMKYEYLFKPVALEGNEVLSKININEPKYSDDSIKMINEKLDFLVCRAKNKHSDEELSKIVKRTIELGIEFNKKIEKSQITDFIGGCIIMTIIAIICYLLS